MPESLCRTVYTIGHSNHPIEVLLALLQRHGITQVVDVRSQPYSRWASQFNRETLQRAVEEAGLRYRFLGDCLGGRPQDPTLYAADSTSEHPRPDYGRMAESHGFVQGLEELMVIAAERPTAVLCSEGDHRQCHRDKLLAPALLQAGWCVQHITPEGETVMASLPPEQLSLF
jgi:uncharacterized protein (DUF488 family)